MVSSDRVLFYLFVCIAVGAVIYYDVVDIEKVVKEYPLVFQLYQWCIADTLHTILGLMIVVAGLEVIFMIFDYIFNGEIRKIYLSPKPPKTVGQASLQARAKTFPPPYPNGWYRLLNSEDLKKGQVKHAFVVGKHFAVFRGEDGKPAILDAFCPHLGANIAVGGKVVGNSVQCPFHGWEFDAFGKCTKIPYADCIPNFAETKSYPVIEYAQMICVYYDARGNEPTYTPKPTPEIESGKLVYKGMWTEEVDMHIQDFSENSADFAHFDVLHSKPALPFCYIKHKLYWRAGKAEEDEECFSYFGDSATLYTSLFNIPLPNVVEAHVTFNGPAGIVYFRFCTIFGADVLLIKTFQPVAPLTQVVQDRYYANPLLPTFLVKFICKEALKAFKDDISVWGNKSYSFRPMLIKEDGPLRACRRWYKQFYCSESLSMSEAFGIVEKRNLGDFKNGDDCDNNIDNNDNKPKGKKNSSEGLSW